MKEISINAILPHTAAIRSFAHLNDFSVKLGMNVLLISINLDFNQELIEKINFAKLVTCIPVVTSHLH